MRTLKLFFLGLALIIVAGDGFSQNKPFPQEKNWANCIKPDKPQSQLNAEVAAFYDTWKANYLRTTNMPGGYYVHGECTGCNEPAKGTSEGHGYGMIITALMAGHDSNAKTYFDGLFKYFDNHRSAGNSELMSWMVEVSENGGNSSAADGDLDIAYALLLAHHQWGSNGAVNYLQEAQDMITYGLKQSDMNVGSKWVMLGDWDNNAYSTRSSDWMTAQMRAYHEATNDNFWLDAAANAYSLINTIQQNYSQPTGLMSDFIVNANPRPAPPYFLEADTDDDFSWNACRFPLRIAVDYGHYGTTEAKTALSKIVNWAKSETGGDPANFKAGYTLSGNSIVDYSSNAFTSPLLAAAVVDPSNQAFLNAGWEQIKDSYYSYYDASINMLCLLFISGNWWVPTGDDNSNQAPTVSITSPTNGTVFTAPTDILISANASDPDGTIASVEFYNGNQRLGDDNSSPYTYNWSDVGEGSYAITARATDDQGSVTISNVVEVFVGTSSSQGPYGGVPWPIPGKIEAEDYDLGGDGVAYSDVSSSNQGDAYRNDLVDIESCEDTGGGYNVGWISEGEWLEYTVNVSTSGNYAIEARVAAISSGRSFHIEVDGQNVSGAINVPNTGDWQSWQTVSVNNISLSAGEKVLRIVMDTDDFNINYVVFEEEGDVGDNVLPTCSITSPSNGQSFSEPASITVTATANDTDGSVEKVEFYNGATKIGEDSTAPYSYTISSLAEGSYTLSAKAFDDEGGIGNSASVNIVVEGSTGGGCDGVQEWNPSEVYLDGDQVQYGGVKYEANWWSQNQNPVQNSGQWRVWTNLGACAAGGRIDTFIDGGFKAYQNEPNPFRDQTTIRFQLVEQSHTRVSVYNYTGKVEVMLLDEVIPAGEHSIELDGVSLQSGIYLLNISSGGNNKTMKIIKR